MEVEVHPAGQWAAAVVERWDAVLARQPAARLCLPTGATPVPVYRGIAAAVDAGVASLAQSEVLLLDEFGGLPAGDPGRCEQMLRRDLLDHVDLPADRFHRPDPDADDLDAECRRYAAAVADGGIDLALLGLGANGHIGLNEPGSSRASRTRRVSLAPETVAAAARYTGDTTPAWGLTLGVAELLEAREVWLLVTGEAKAAILARVLEGPVGPDVPATFLREHPRARVLADAPAAGALTPPRAPGRRGPDESRA